MCFRLTFWHILLNPFRLFNLIPHRSCTFKWAKQNQHQTNTFASHFCVKSLFVMDNGYASNWSAHSRNKLVSNIEEENRSTVLNQHPFVLYVNQKKSTCFHWVSFIKMKWEIIRWLPWRMPLKPIKGSLIITIAIFAAHENCDSNLGYKSNQRMNDEKVPSNQNLATSFTKKRRSNLQTRYWSTVSNSIRIKRIRLKWRSIFETQTKKKRKKTQLKLDSLSQNSSINSRHCLIKYLR